MSCGLACVLMESSTRKGFDVAQGLRQGCALSPYLLSLFFAAALHVVLVRFSQEEAIVRDSIQVSDAGVVRTKKQELLACVPWAVWGTCCTPMAQ